MSNTERVLSRIWCKALELQEVGIDDDFFDLGGNSFTAFVLLVEIEREFSKSPGIGEVWETNTIRKQAAFLDHAEIPANRGDIRPLLLKGKFCNERTRPLFLVHGTVSDELDCYFHLVRSLPSELSVYGLQSYGKLTGSELETIEEMARQHVKAIRSVQPSGPYYLGGYCFGGLIAYEIAQQLTASGECVQSLSVFDYPINFAEPFQFPTTSSRLRTILANCGLAILDLRKSKKSLTACINEVAVWLYRMAVMKSLGGTNGAPKTGFWHSVHLTPVESQCSSAQFRALRKYQPRPYSGSVTLFRHRRLPILQPYDFSMGWSKICSTGLKVTIVDGSSSHGSMLRAENAPKVARELVKTLAPLMAPGDAHGASTNGERTPILDSQ